MKGDCNELPDRLKLDPLEEEGEVPGTSVSSRFRKFGNVKTSTDVDVTRGCTSASPPTLPFTGPLPSVVFAARPSLAAHHHLRPTSNFYSCLRSVHLSFRPPFDEPPRPLFRITGLRRMAHRLPPFFLPFFRLFLFCLASTGGASALPASSGVAIAIG